jgi:hypothetical protein
MVNYSASESSMSGGSLVGGSKIGGSEIGGALNVLSQYDANTEGDEYSANNPSNEYLEMLKKQHGGALKKLGGAGGMRNDVVAKHILSLSSPEHHALVETAKAMMRKGGSVIGGALGDIASSKSPSHLASMVMTDHHMKKEEGGSAVGGSFLDDLGNTAKGLAPFLPLLL